MSDEYTNAPPMELGEERVIHGVTVRAVRFTSHAHTTCEHCPLMREPCTTTRGPHGVYVCGGENSKHVRLVPVDMVPVLFLKGKLS